MSELVHNVKSVAKSYGSPPRNDYEVVTYCNGEITDDFARGFWNSVASSTEGRTAGECFQQYSYILDTGLAHFDSHHHNHHNHHNRLDHGEPRLEVKRTHSVD